MILGGLTGLQYMYNVHVCHEALHSGTDLLCILCVLGNLLSWTVFSYALGIFPRIFCILLLLYRIGEVQWTPGPLLQGTALRHWSSVCFMYVWHFRCFGQCSYTSKIFPSLCCFPPILIMPYLVMLGGLTGLHVHVCTCKCHEVLYSDADLLCILCMLQANVWITYTQLP